MTRSTTFTFDNSPKTKSPDPLRSQARALAMATRDRQGWFERDLRELPTGSTALVRDLNTKTADMWRKIGADTWADAGSFVRTSHALRRHGIVVSVFEADGVVA